jgi:hypothetical protein
MDATRCSHHQNASNLCKVISIDAATKSLAVACLSLKCSECQKHEIVQLVKVVTMAGYCAPDAEVSSALASSVKQVFVESLEVVDLIPGSKVSKTTLIERTSALVSFLHKLTNRLIDCDWFGESTHLLIEYQMGPNRKSGDIQTQIIYHFMQYLPVANIHIVGPSLKNKLHYLADSGSQHSSHIAKFDTLYSANKSHTKYVFLKWLAAFGELSHIANISKKNYADIADAFCQAVAWNLNRCYNRRIYS